MTDTSANEIIDFPVELIIASRTNPRTVFDPAYIEELGGTIKQAGRVLQPILLRPLPASRLEETAHLKPRPTHEIIFGECRFRATNWAKLKTIRATVEDMTDAQVLVAQLIENLKRKDLSELEEAEGYRRLMDETGLNAEQVGQKIEKSRTYVYNSLKLLELCTEARASLREGTVDASCALVVARIPDHKLQIKAMKEIVAGSGYYADREPMSYRKALEHVQRNYMLKLSEAKFKITSVDLVPAAGSCKTCTKRTGHDPDLFSDVKGADVCTDPPCFHKKEEAHAAALVKEAKDKGQTVIAGKEAQELRSNNHSDKFVGYRRLDSVVDSPTDQPLRKLIGHLMKSEGIKPVLIESTRNKGEMVECLPNEVALKLLKIAEQQAAAASQQGSGAPKISKEVQKLVDDKKAKAEAKAKAQFEREWRANLVADSWVAIRDDADIKPFTIDVHRFLAVRAARNLSTDDAARICELLDLGKVSPISAVSDFARETPAPDMLHLLIVMQTASEPDSRTYEFGSTVVYNEGLMLVAGNVFGSQLDDVIKEIKAEVKAKIWPKVAKKAPPPIAPLAQPTPAAGKAKTKDAKPAAKKAKLSAQDAQLGIAAAMQGMEGASAAPKGAVASPAGPAGARGSAAADENDLYDQAVELVTREQKASKRLLKEQLSIGQDKALALLERMEANGVVSAVDETRNRKVLVAA